MIERLSKVINATHTTCCPRTNTSSEGVVVLWPGVAEDEGEGVNDRESGGGGEVKRWPQLMGQFLSTHFEASRP